MFNQSSIINISNLKSFHCLSKSLFDPRYRMSVSLCSMDSNDLNNYWDPELLPVLAATELFGPDYHDNDTMTIEDIKSEDLQPSYHESEEAQLQFPDETCTDAPTTVYQSQLGPPPKNNHPGDYNFQISINAEACKKKYLYSYKFNRIYVDMQVNFPIQFSWDYHSAYGKFFVRATTAFSAEDQAQKRVERCINHRYCEKTNINGCENIKMHVLRSAIPYGAEGVYYYGDENNQMSWYSVLIPYPMRPPDGNKEFVHPYVFVCQTSCNSGINRRPIEIVFTLEDESGKVLGRQSVGVKVCRCPKRDIRKDEKEETPNDSRPGKRKTLQSGPTPKRLQQSAPEEKKDHEVYYLPVIGKNNAQILLPVINKFMRADAAEAQTNDTRTKYLELIKQNEDMLQDLTNQILFERIPKTASILLTQHGYSIM